MSEEISNSFLNNNTIIVSNTETVFSSSFPAGISANTPVLYFKINALLPNPLEYKVRIKTFETLLINGVNGEYRDVSDSDVWTSFTREQIDSMVSPTRESPILGIIWSGSVSTRNRQYMSFKGNASSLQDFNYIYFDLKRAEGFSGISDAQLHVRISFEEVVEVSENVFEPTVGMNRIVNEAGEDKITFKTMNGSNNLGIRTINPDIGSVINKPSYINSTSFIVDITGQSGFAEYYAYYINDNPISAWNTMPSKNPDKTVSLPISIPSESKDGEYRISIIARDSYFNKTDIENAITFDVIKSTTGPFDCELNIYGQDGNSRYAGIRINKDKSFTPDRMVNLVFFGNSELPMTCRIYCNNLHVALPKITTILDSSGSIEKIQAGDISEEAKTMTSDSSNSVSDFCDTGEFLYKHTIGQDKDRAINTIECYLIGNDYNESSPRSVTITFTDVAGNSVTITKDIMLNNRIFSCKKKNLREQGSDYAHVVMKQNSYGAFDTVQETVPGKEDVFKRTWNDIYFPESQSPKMKGKDIDIDWCVAAYRQYENSGGKFSYSDVSEYGLIKMEKDENENYLPVVDSEGRYTSIWNNSKFYNSYVSRNRSDIWFRVIDNAEYGDITLEFERFDMNSKAGSMANATAGGYKGDVVMIYKADDGRCLTEKVNADGTISYPVDGLNTVYMELLAVYSGSNGNVYDLLSGNSVGAKEDSGAFSVTFNCSKICIIVCTDSSEQSSGFKIKAGKKNGMTYSNYDVDETNGELWYHGESDSWGSTDKKIRMFYDYYDSSVSYDYDRGFVIINTNDLPDDAIITCDYSYYKKIDDYNVEDSLWLNGDGETSETSVKNYRMYLASEDDLYEYLVPSVYVTKRFDKINKEGEIHIPNSGISGKFTDSYWIIDKDRGAIEINRTNGSKPWGNVPFNEDGYPMRITMDYTHHTFYRLSNDGYGNVHFEDKVIVADSTPIYPDATWADIMIVNEGDAILENGLLVFKCRGETEGGSEEVRKPLDVNRPWDVQEGKKAVTWDKCRMFVSDTYNTAEDFKFSPTISDLRKTYKKSNKDGASLKRNNKYLSPKDYIFGRVIWNLAGEADSDGDASYPTDGLVVGRKSWSAEISGRYYVVED